MFLVISLEVFSSYLMSSSIHFISLSNPTALTARRTYRRLTLLIASLLQDAISSGNREGRTTSWTRMDRRQVSFLSLAEIVECVLTFQSRTPYREEGGCEQQETSRIAIQEAHDQVSNILETHFYACTD